MYETTSTLPNYIFGEFPVARNLIINGGAIRPTGLLSSLKFKDQPFASSEMGDSMDPDLLPELSGETWVASALLEELSVDLPTAGSDIDLIVASRQDATLTTVREWLQSGVVPAWLECAGLSPELRCWRLQIGNLSVDTDVAVLLYREFLSWSCHAGNAGI